MYTSYDSLHAGLVEASLKKHPTWGAGEVFLLFDLERLTGQLIEGDHFAKVEARKELKKLLGRGRCIMNARDLAIKLNLSANKNRPCKYSEKVVSCDLAASPSCDICETKLGSKSV
jgi:hypothetical protein